MLSFEDFSSGLLSVNSTQPRRDLIYCEWETPDKQRVFYERAHYPWSPFKQVTIHYLGETIYTDKTTAENDAKKYNARIVEFPYCEPENLMWFLSFDNFDDAARAAYDQIYLLQLQDGNQ